MMRTLGQQRAAFALSEVLSGKCDSLKDFKSLCSGAPAVILQNGFGQALAFWYAKGKDKPGDKHQVLLNIIMRWLCHDQNGVHNRFVPKCGTTREMVSALSSMSQQAYLAAQGETLALLEWVKRYAIALLPGEKQ